MDDNELENEREKREHELAMAELTQQPNGWVALWEVIGENMFVVLFIVIVIMGGIVSLKTGQKFGW